MAPEARTAVVSVTGQRDHNEDVGRVLHGEAAGEPVTLLLVADGMGGHANGEVASRLAAEALESLWRQLLSDLDGATAPSETPEAEREAIARAFLRAAFADAEGLIQRESRGSGMGTTLVAALAWGECAVLANIGDSRAYLVRDADAELLTHDHSVVADAVRQGALTPEEAERSPYQHALTRALDGRGDAEPDLYPARGCITLGPTSVLLLCSDGLSGVMQPADLRDHLARTPDLASGARALVAGALDRGSPDNVTVALLETGALIRTGSPPLLADRVDALLAEPLAPEAPPESPSPEARDVHARETLGRTPWLLGALALLLLALAVFAWTRRDAPPPEAPALPLAPEAAPVRASAFELTREGDALTWRIRGIPVASDSARVTVSRDSLALAVSARGGMLPLAAVAASWPGGELAPGEYVWRVEARSQSGSRLRSASAPLILTRPVRASGAQPPPLADGP